jgi:hypothetical protein
MVALAVLSATAYVAGADDDPGQRYLRKASQQGVSPFQKAAYEQLAKLHESKDFAGGELEGITRNADDPMAVLHKMGLDVLPVLVDALDDTTPTQAFPGGPMSNGEPCPYTVSALAAGLIVGISDREFAIIDGGEETSISGSPPPGLAPKFRTAILDWYAKYAKKTPAERKIADVNSDFFRNRFSAIGWIAAHKEKTGLKAVLERIDAILAFNGSNSLLNEELAICSGALASFGDARNVDYVRRICKHFSENGLLNGSNSIRVEFLAFSGLAELAGRNEALREFTRLRNAQIAYMEPAQGEEFDRFLEIAKSTWLRSPLDKVSELDQLLEKGKYKEYFVAAVPPKVRAEIEKGQGYEKWEKDDLLKNAQFYRDLFAAMKGSAATIHDVETSPKAVFTFRKPVGKCAAASLIMVDEVWYLGGVDEKGPAVVQPNPPDGRK